MTTSPVEDFEPRTSSRAEDTSFQAATAAAGRMLEDITKPTARTESNLPESSRTISAASDSSKSSNNSLPELSISMDPAAKSHDGNNRPAAAVSTDSTMYAAKAGDGALGKNMVAAANDSGKDEVIHRWYGYGEGSGGRQWHNVTRGEWEKKSHDLAKAETDSAIRDINRHSSRSDLEKDAGHLAKALERAEAHMSKDEFQKLLKDLPKLTGNKVYADDGKLKVKDGIFRDTVVYDPSNHTPKPYDIRSQYPGIY